MFHRQWIPMRISLNEWGRALNAKSSTYLPKWNIYYRHCLHVHLKNEVLYKSLWRQYVPLSAIPISLCRFMLTSCKWQKIDQCDFTLESPSAVVSESLYVVNKEFNFCTIMIRSFVSVWRHCGLISIGIGKASTSSSVEFWTHDEFCNSRISSVSILIFGDGIELNTPCWCDISKDTSSLTFPMLIILWWTT